MFEQLLPQYLMEDPCQVLWCMQLMKYLSKLLLLHLRPVLQEVIFFIDGVLLSNEVKILFLGELQMFFLDWIIYCLIDQQFLFLFYLHYLQFQELKIFILSCYNFFYYFINKYKIIINFSLKKHSKKCF
jgi:hypothetical protein